MGLMSGLLKAGIAKKVYDEARKPHNQAKIRSAVDRVRSSRGGAGGTGRAPRR